MKFKKMLRSFAMLGAAGYLLNACSGGNEEDNLAVMEWAGYEKTRYHADYFAKYQKEPDYTFFADQEDAIQRMRTGYRVDLVHLCAEQVAVSRDAGLIKPLDISRIPEWGNITPELLELDGVKVDGEYWIVPWEWGYSGIAYNPEMIDVENPTYDIFIDPELEGKTALPTAVDVNVLIAAVIGKWENPHDPTEEEMAAVPEIFTKMLKNARFIWTDNTQIEQAWAAGDVGVSYVYGSGSRHMKERGMGVQMIEPVMTWMCGLSIGTSGTVSEEMVYDYINSMLATNSGVALFEGYGYGHGNAKTMALLDPVKVREAGIENPVELFARGIYNTVLPPAKKGRLIQAWFEAQAGLN